MPSPKCTLQSTTLAFICLLALSSWACSYSYTYARMSPQKSASLPAPIQDATFVEQASTFGLVLDVRYARFLYGTQYFDYDLEADLTPPDRIYETSQGDKGKGSGDERFIRMDIPLLTLWNFESPKMFAYPGPLKNRKTVELWARAGASFPLTDRDAFLGAALTFYFAPYIAVSLTGDWRSAPRSITTSTGTALSAYDTTASGPVFGIEITAGAGEVALNMLEDLWDIDQAHQKRVRDRRGR